MSVKIACARFTPETGIKEYFFAGSSAPDKDFAAEAEKLIAAYEKSCADCGTSEKNEVFLRFHLSDITNQQHILEKLLADRNSFISIVGQPPAGKSRIALEAWHWQNISGKLRNDNTLTVNMENYQPCWFSCDTLSSSGSYDQTAEEFDSLKSFLASRNANVADHTVRTWLYCRDVDNNYAGLVQARNHFFAANGLTGDTHFIASTGIEGQSLYSKRLVKMDSINYPGLQPGQMFYLCAPDMLSPTAIYGVSFERGTQLLFGDRSHIFISGTASIDHKGKVLHLYDVVKQTHRMLDNILALLEKAHATEKNIKLATLYLRDIADAQAVQQVIFERFGDSLPLVTVKAPVCRPEWLVEMECIAVNDYGDGRFKSFK